MYFPIKSTQAFWCFLLVIFGPISLTAQEQSCSVSPPQTVEVTEMDYGYTLDWSPEEEASSYRVIVLDTESSEQIFDESVQEAQVEIYGLTLTEHTFVGIASVCENGEEGSYGYFGIESNSTIIVQDIVMQMQGETIPRTLECEVETEQLIASAVSGQLRTNFTVTPPSNGVANFQIQGAIVDISLVEQSTGNLFAQATMLSHSNNTLLNTTTPVNVTNSGNSYDFINPAHQHFFSYTNPVQGQFNFAIDAGLPGDGAYYLLVEQRNCLNVNKITRTSAQVTHGLRSSGSSTPQSTGNFVMERVAESSVLRVYPNPTTDQIMFDVLTQEINVFDSYGRRVLQTVNPTPQQTIQVSHWPAGTYFVHAISAEGEVLVSQFQKQ